jgi:hypothetical protein
MSYLAGNIPYTTTLRTTTVGTAQTAIYEVAPVTCLATTKLLIMASSSFFGHNSSDIQLTVGRATTSSATAANSTNIVSNVSPLVLPQTSTAHYICAFPGLNGTNGHSININGFAIDAPGAGTFYYTIWMTSSQSHNYSEMTAALSVLQIHS